MDLMLIRRQAVKLLSQDFSFIKSRMVSDSSSILNISKKKLNHFAAFYKMRIENAFLSVTSNVSQRISQLYTPAHITSSFHIIICIDNINNNTSDYDPLVDLIFLTSTCLLSLIASNVHDLESQMNIITNIKYSRRIFSFRVLEYSLCIDNHVITSIKSIVIRID